jgi:hypothetical protein
VELVVVAKLAQLGHEAHRDHKVNPHMRLPLMKDLLVVKKNGLIQ